jgi:hypothetical protein
VSADPAADFAAALAFGLLRVRAAAVAAPHLIGKRTKKIEPSETGPKT